LEVLFYGKKENYPGGKSIRKKVLVMLQDAGINDVAGVQELLKEMGSTVLKNDLAAELDEELGYSKYDYRNKQTDNRRNGFSEKTMKTSFRDMDISVPRYHKGEFEPLTLSYKFKHRINLLTR
jgi:putative transposase